MATTNRSKAWSASVLAFLAMFLMSFCGHAEESTHAVVRLKYRANAYSVQFAGRRASADITFKKEPPYQGHKVIRGPLFLGANPKDYIGFAWDQAADKLYLDLNRNQDLSDEKAIVPGHHTSPNSLGDVTLNVEGPTPRVYQMMMDIIPLRDAVLCLATLRSGWQGEVTIDGVPWTMAVIDNLDGKIDSQDKLLFYRTREYLAVDGAQALDMYGMAADSQLCVADTLIDLAYQFESIGENSDLVVTLDQKKLPSGELQITGEHLERVILEGARNVILDLPRGTARVPVGSYSVGAVCVADAAKKYRFICGSVPGGRASGKSVLPAISVDVKEGQSAPLKLGAPLNNQVRIARSGACLSFSHFVAGLAGEQYEDLAGRRDAASAPSVTMYKDGQKVATGKFEYG